MTYLEAGTITWIEEVLARYYAVGTLQRVRRMAGGFINTSYEILTETGSGKPAKYLLRCYQPTQRERDIRFEHALLNALTDRDFDLHPGPVFTTGRQTYIRVADSKAGTPGRVFLSLFTYIAGENRYRWDRPRCADADLRAAASVLARYHNTIHQWDGAKLCGKVPVIDTIPEMQEKWEAYTKLAGSALFDAYFLNHADYMFRHLQWVWNIAQQNGYAEMPQVVVHGDYHPGNLKFHGSRVIGLLDFDWSQQDLRAFDVGLALGYFCTSWKQQEDGRLRTGRIRQFLDAYQQEAAGAAGLGPLNALELAHLPAMILLGNLFVFNWILDARFIDRRDGAEYLRYLQHNTNAAKSLDRQWRELKLLPGSLMTVN